MYLDTGMSVYVFTVKKQTTKTLNEDRSYCLKTPDLFLSSRSKKRRNPKLNPGGGPSGGPKLFMGRGHRGILGYLKK